MQAACKQAEREKAARTLGDRWDVRRITRERVVCDRTQRERSYAEQKFIQTIIVDPTILIYDINRYSIIPAVFLFDFLVSFNLLFVVPNIFFYKCLAVLLCFARFNLESLSQNCTSFSMFSFVMKDFIYKKKLVFHILEYSMIKININK